MSIPMYFAGNWKDSVNGKAFLRAQLGYGFYADGTVRLPEERDRSALCVIDDAIVPRSPAALEALCTAVTNGCCFDFEQPPTDMHRAIIQAVAPHVEGLILVPEEYQTNCDGILPMVRAITPCNNWTATMIRAKKRHPGGWAMELSPWLAAHHYSKGETTEGYLEASRCKFLIRDGILYYYDTAETIRAKIKIAAQHGCQAVIGLYQEFAELHII